MRRLAVLTLLVLGMLSVPAQAQAPGACNGLDVNDDRATDAADFLTGTPERDVIALGDANDQYFAAEGGDIICGNLGDDLLVGEAGNDELTGGSGDDTLVGFSGADQILAGNGADILRGEDGADILTAGTVDDTRDDIYDGLGSDTIVGQAEDFWIKCADGIGDDHDGFLGTTVPDPDCNA